MAAAGGGDGGSGGADVISALLTDEAAGGAKNARSFVAVTASQVRRNTHTRRDSDMCDVACVICPSSLPPVTACSLSCPRVPRSLWPRTLLVSCIASHLPFSVC